MPETYDIPEALTEEVWRARSIGVVTGAGISAESGIPTYRGKGGIYDDPEEGDRTVEALSGSTLSRDPDRTWRALAGMARSAGAAEPNAAHEALVTLESTCERFVLLTQNVDGLHRRAGSRNVIEIHGHLFDTFCIACGHEASIEDFAAITAAPRCASCGGLVRPDVVLFEEMLPELKLARIAREMIHDVPDVTLVIGTTAMFPYIAEPVMVAARAGKTTVEINPEPSYLTPTVDFHLRGRAGDWLPALVTAREIGNR